MAGYTLITQYHKSTDNHLNTTTCLVPAPTTTATTSRACRARIKAACSTWGIHKAADEAPAPHPPGSLLHSYLSTGGVKVTPS
ncbi:hypothetical protein E2C01_043341 [Portunus trituberculatus]|uniref:Uncharacterized protein n=1 Tax=Portunus trituberculatus TaxID=210409 RepID=A0A5B7FVW2_PORTR|nr:hypothetical protein [Portunus trituberculatus]